VRSACSLCSAALQSPEQWERGLCDRCWSGRPVPGPATSTRRGTGWLAALAFAAVAILVVAQITGLERELDATREALVAARVTQARQDEVIRDAERRLVEIGPPCSALVDLHPALSRRAAVRGQR
jgi:hypothetical protein